ncbi:hypothetical protein [Paraburkholderia kururiensis]|uniref:8-oxoguanine DNA glycosylase OGG fold protein n=1 Tax=Paraburkholderia kururiensis TaxID=984307 RepID=UPI0039A5B8F4
MTLAELIQGITAEHVSEQTFRYEPRNWVAYEPMRECLLALGYTQAHLEHGFLLSRANVTTAFRAAEGRAATDGRQLLAATVALVPIWGYPRGVVGPGNRGPIHSVLHNRMEIAKHLAGFATTDVSTDAIVTAMTYDHVGLSTLSKLLYFAGLSSHEGSLLIYDQMVMRALNYHHFEEYGRWPEYSAHAQRTTYAEFISKTASAAASLGSRPDVIEYALFAEGQRLGKPMLFAATHEVDAMVRVEPPLEDSLEELVTFSGTAKFRAHFHSNGDVTLRYGTAGIKRVPAAILVALARHFSGAIIPLTAKAGSSLQGWLEENFSRIRLASYVGQVLVRLGYAVREGNALRFGARPD